MKKGIRLSIFFMIIAVYVTQATQQPDLIYVRKWKVDATEREAMVYIPASAKSRLTPVIFVFHGHGGNMKEMFNSHRFDKLWPEAIVVVPQGLNTPGQLVDRAGNLPGWQQAPGEMADRDVHFFDAILQSLRNEYQIDGKQIFATGHSNGGGFTYLLWAMRGDVLAALAPSAAVAFRFNDRLMPKPIMHIIGEKDPLVKPQWQQMQIVKLLRLNQCSAEGRPYADSAVLYSSLINDPVVIVKHTGGHVYPQSAGPTVIKFFRSVATIKN